MQISCASNLFDAPDLSACDLCVLALVIDIEQLARLFGIEEQTARTDELECVPLCGIVTRRNRDATLRPAVAHLKLNCGNRTHADIDHATSG